MMRSAKPLANAHTAKTRKTGNIGAFKGPGRASSRQIFGTVAAARQTGARSADGTLRAFPRRVVSMSAVSSHTKSLTSSFELRNATLALVALVLKTTDLTVLAHALEERFGQTPLFDHDPVVIDLSQLDAAVGEIDFGALAGLLRAHRMVPAGVEGGSVAQMEAALEAGLGATSTLVAGAPRTEPPARRDGARAANDAKTAKGATAAKAGAPSAESASSVPTLVIDRPLRSGQQVYARGGDLVVMAAVNFGAEVIADGHIHVYAPLRGRAIAGARGNAAARIFSTCMEPQLVAIAGTYRTAETALADDVLGKPAQVRLDGEMLVVEPLGG
jgi:septum site-determining protein MinC